MTSNLTPHVDDDDSDYYASAHMVRGRRSTSTPTSPVGSSVRRVLSQRRLSSDINALGNQLRHVRFSDNELESTQHTLSTHHQTPHEPKQVIHNTSSRRLSIDEVELYFSDFTKFPPSVHDYVVSKLLKRNDILIASALEFVKSSRNLAFFAKSKVYWVELHNGVMVLHAKRDAVDASPEKMFITGCTPRIVSVRECTMEIEHVFQQKKDYQLVQFQNKMDLFLWWWALQLASVNKAGPTKHSALSMFQLIEVSNPVGNVVFPWPSRGAVSARRAASTRPSVTHLILVRHGEAENMHFRVPDEEKGLTKRGREQAASTAAHVAEMLKKAGAGEDNVQLVYGGLRRTRETGEEFVNAMPWLKQKNECCLLEDGAPACIEYTHRMDFRTAMHCTAFETLCRPDANEFQRMSSDETSHENFKILICHASFVQHCIAVSCKVSKDVVKIGAPIGHCSITQINATKESGQKDDFKVAFTNRVGHLRLTHRTSE